MAKYTLPREQVLRSTLTQRVNGLERMANRHAKERADAERMIAIVRAELEYELSQKERGEA